MKCANCDAQIKDGSIYCPVCGKEAQMVNGYTSLEDDFLHSLLREGINPQTKKKSRVLSHEELVREQKRKQRMSIIIGCLIAAVILATFIVIKLFIDYKNDNSYDYQMKMAQAEIVDHNYESAMEYLARALAIVPNDVDSRMELAEIYLMKEEYDAAAILLTEVIRLDDDKKEAYQYLIDIYSEKEQYEQIKALAEYADKEEIKELFADYLVASPNLYPSGDTFYSELKVTIFSVDDHAIYYTLDGTDPVTNGKRYVEGAGIKLNNSGLYTIRAVCKNRNDIYSEIVEHDYQIVLTPPEETEADTEIVETRIIE
ncbi:MAG: chitobiase/beta-hexosaminidase C-terminal domain-containing protein [Roseburia sp.]|nr:chitobiase/beta-hexosaminidase C-terminal domain-containing protein [Roseburia sp.]